jgi:hypothetical protein
MEANRTFLIPEVISDITLQLSHVFLDPFSSLRTTVIIL